jgi:hypothetical protein
MERLPGRSSDAGPQGMATAMKWDEECIEAEDFIRTCLDYTCMDAIDEAKMRLSLLNRAEDHLENAKAQMKDRIRKLEALRGLVVTMAAPQLADQATAEAYASLAAAGCSLEEAQALQEGSVA